jgi:predicted small secreted protein
MKKSNAVPLLLLGSTALLAGCTRNDAEGISETRQDAYRTKEACGRDWADDACSHSGGAYVGPRYFYSHGDRTPYIIDNDGRTRAVPGHYGAYNSHRADAAGVPAAAPGRTTTVTHNAGSSSRSSIFRGGFGGGRSSGSSGG